MIILPQVLVNYILAYLYPHEVYGKKKYIKDIKKYQFLCKKCRKQEYQSYNYLCNSCLFKNMKLFNIMNKDFYNIHVQLKLRKFTQLMFQDLLFSYAPDDNEYNLIYSFIDFYYYN